MQFVVGAAGELFAIEQTCTHVERHYPRWFYYIVRSCTRRILFNMTQTYAIETASANVKKSLNAKLEFRQGIQSSYDYVLYWIFFKYGTLSFQYISHRVYDGV
jgi:hypothetical protein